MKTKEEIEKQIYFSACCPPPVKKAILELYLRFYELNGRDPSSEEFCDIIAGKNSNIAIHDEPAGLNGLNV